MRAIVIQGPGQLRDLVLAEIPIPEIDENEVLVRIEAIGVGNHDRWAIPGNARYPYAIGVEAAGVVQNVGSAVRDRKPGDRVMFQGMQQPKGGTWADYAAVSGPSLIDLPDQLDAVEAACLPVAGSTALEGLNALGLQAGDTLFIAGASGAIGTLAIQLATLRGLRVAASASPTNHEYLLSLGAELALDYRDPEWVGKLRRWMPDGVDAALAIQPGTGTTSLPAVRDGGKIVTVSGDQVSTERAISAQQLEHHPETRNELIQLAADVASGRVRVVVEHTYPFARGLEALEKTETRHARGKIVLTMENREDTSPTAGEAAPSQSRSSRPMTP